MVLNATFNKISVILSMWLSVLVVEETIRNLIHFTGLKTNLTNLKSLTKNCGEKLKRGYN
jgi:hypothetical protein